VGKFTSAERSQVKSLVAELSKKRIPDSLIINEISRKTDIIDMLYTKPRHKPNDGSGASSWDSDY
jgi:hypothetical protein